VTGGAGPLLEQIRSAAAAAASEKLASARAEADAIRAAAAQGATRRRTAALAAHERDAAAAQSRTRSETSARVGRDTLVARAAALDRVFAEAELEFKALAVHPGLRDALVATISDGLTYLPSAAAGVRCQAAVEPAVRAALAAIKREDVAVRVDESVPVGAVIEAGDGSVSVDGTFARRLARERANLSTVVARRLLELPA
jgi:vacuolar-type H+-ATPase subunit E/Vma4